MLNPMAWRLGEMFALTMFCGFIGCGGATAESEPDPDPEPEAGCAPEEFDLAGLCEPIGLPSDLICAPGEQATEAGCVPAGVPAMRCAEGFAASDGGCEAVLPAMDCLPGEMALLGETSCHPVAACPAMGWGDAPVEAGAVYVDASFAGAADGSEAAPWPTIQQAVDAAADGTQILIAAGTYAEHVLIEGKGVRLWGTCPGAVAIQGPPSGVGAIDVINGAHGTEVHRIAISGARVGLGVSDATGVILDELWVHDTGDQALLADRVLGPAEVTVRRTLVERTGLGGMVIVGGEVTIEDSVFRDAQGRGVDVLASPFDGEPAEVVAEGIVVANTTGGGFVVAGSSASISRAAVLDTAPDESDKRGWGIAIFDVPGLPPTLGELVDSVVERSHDAGVIASGSSVLVEGVTVRDVRASLSGPGGVGLIVDAWAGTSAAVTAEVRQSLIEGASGLGLFINGALDVTVEGVQVRDTKVDGNGGYGWGVSIQYAPDLVQAASVTMASSWVRRSVGGGVLVYGSALTMETTAIDDTVSGPSGRFGSALVVVDDPASGTPSTGQVWASRFSRSAEAGVVMAGSQLAIDQSVIEATVANGLGTYGDGLLVFGVPASAGRLDLMRTRVADSDRAGVACFGSSVGVANSVLACTDFALDAEPFAGRDCELTDLGGNACGCEALDEVCKAVSSSLEPPQPVDAPFEPPH
jgi:hypothetical protein